MRNRLLPISLASVVLTLSLLHPRSSEAPAAPMPPSRTEADGMLRRLPSPFVPNLGQWEHSAKFVRDRTWNQRRSY